MVHFEQDPVEVESNLVVRWHARRWAAKYRYRPGVLQVSAHLRGSRERHKQVDVGHRSQRRIDVEPMCEIAALEHDHLRADQLERAPQPASQRILAVDVESRGRRAPGGVAHERRERRLGLQQGQEPFVEARARDELGARLCLRRPARAGCPQRDDLPE